MSFKPNLETPKSHLGQRYLANIFQGRIEYGLIYILRGALLYGPGEDTFIDISPYASVSVNS